MELVWDCVQWWTLVLTVFEPAGFTTKQWCDKYWHIPRILSYCYAILQAVAAKFTVLYALYLMWRSVYIFLSVVLNSLSNLQSVQISQP